MATTPSESSTPAVSVETPSANPSKVSQAAAKAPVKSAPVKSASVKTSPKVAPKPAAPKTAAAPVSKPATAKPVAAKPVAAKPAATQPVVSKPAAAKPSTAPVEVLKVKKTKLVRDSFTMPKDEYAAIDSLKLRAGKLGQPVKKSELLRAGIKALTAMSDIAYKAALSNVPTIKTGRPKDTK